MNPIYIFNLAAQHTHWASVRQTVVAGNIANANTVGYQTQDIEPFSAVMQQTETRMARTAAQHLDVTGAVGGEAAEWGTVASGGPVSIDKELVKADEVNRAYSLDTSIMNSFHRMLLASVRGG